MMKKSEILKFFDTQRAVILTTMNGDVPETRALHNIRNRQVSPYLVEYFNKKRSYVIGYSNQQR